MDAESEKTQIALYRCLIGSVVSTSMAFRDESSEFKAEIDEMCRRLEAVPGEFDPDGTAESLGAEVSPLAIAIMSGRRLNNPEWTRDSLLRVGPLGWPRLGQWMAAESDEFPYTCTHLRMLDYLRFLEIEYLSLLLVTQQS